MLRGVKEVSAAMRLRSARSLPGGCPFDMNFTAPLAATIRFSMLYLRHSRTGLEVDKQPVNFQTLRSPTGSKAQIKLLSLMRKP